MKIRSSRRVAGAAAIAAVALAVPAQSLAARPPLGLYQCYLSGQYSDGFKLVTKKKYKAVSGGKGRYAVHGKQVKFKSGPFHAFWGRTRRDANGGGWIIDLTLKEDPHVQESCAH
ncbi:MAG: hypothetical protein QOG63_1232 [Thermoleophilaceae bacterium]|nr:hypothetical protein [Thermoleophilaceae bacterium]